ncbi:MAG: nicotinate-nicotinamide nucleotide adenylyltransferase [Desulfuromonas sp.]|nr:MAG: nicotinate-nicotinamide nucleotide adenylyltransferase [Desulfuromonas sp.]
MKIGILGGTFNPIHLAHLRIAEEVRQACALDQVWFLPAADPPHKVVAGQVGFRQRLAMVEAAIADHPHFRVSDLEARRSGKSYSVDTLEILSLEHPEHSYTFIMGLDSFRDLSSWHQWARLFEFAHLVVVSRPGIPVEAPLELLPVAIRDQFCYDCPSSLLRHRSGKTVLFLTETYLDISSTRLREMVAARQSIRYLVPPVVEAFIEQHALYRGQESA